MRAASHLVLALCHFLLCAASATHADAQPQRIVSLNVCIDQILVDLVPRERIAAVTHLAADPLSSAHPERAAGLAITRGGAEDVLSRNADLVLAGQYSTPATVDLLRRLGHRVVLIALPDSIDGVRDVIGKIAAAVGEEARGAAMIGDLDRRIAAARAPALPDAPSALVYQVNNYVAGTFGLINEALLLAGWRNGAASIGVSRNGTISLEALVAAPPDLLVLASEPQTYATVVADNLRHPLLAHLRKTRASTVVPWPLMLCGTQHIAEVVEALAAARRAFDGRRS